MVGLDDGACRTARSVFLWLMGGVIGSSTPLAAGYLLAEKFEVC